MSLDDWTTNLPSSFPNEKLAAVEQKRRKSTFTIADRVR